MKFRNLFKTGNIRQKLSSMTIILLLFSLLIPHRVYAVDTVPTEEYVIKWESRKNLPVDTNLVEDWPQGPIIGAESVVLMEVETGTLLYAKNVNEQLYPASITKLMTALLVVENCQMNEVVTFSNEAIDNTEWGSSRIGIMKGEELTVEECLYGLLLGSANEVAYGLAEHVGGTLDNFVEMMNARAAELGCTNTHFANASGLPNPDHYVSAMDMAKIAQAFFSNDTLCMISGTYTYTIGPTNKTNESRPLDNHHKMIIGKKYAYDGIIGGKTGFTSDARQTLVTCAQKEGMKLICVIMQDESPYQFLDTKELFDYGFEGFKKLKISDYEERYNITSKNFFNTNVDIMGSSKSLLNINEFGYVVIPKTLEFNNLRVEVDYDNKPSSSVAALRYYVGTNSVGDTTIDYASNENNTFEFANIITDAGKDESYTYESEQKTVFLTITSIFKKLLTVIGILLAATILMAMIFAFIKSAKRAQLKTKKRYKQRSENSHRYNYKKRSENIRRKAPATDTTNSKTSGKKYIEPVYKELSKRSESAANTSTVNEIDVKRRQYENELYFDNEEAESFDMDTAGFYDEYGYASVFAEDPFEDGYEDMGTQEEVSYGYDIPQQMPESGYVTENPYSIPRTAAPTIDDLTNGSTGQIKLSPLDDPNRWE